MAKRKLTLQERLDNTEYVWVKNSDTRIRCQRPACRFNQKATYHKFLKVLDEERYYGWFCAECHQASPFTAENGFSQSKPSSLQEGK